MVVRKGETREDVIRRHKVELREFDKRAKDKRVDMVVATMSPGEPGMKHTIEIRFPPDLPKIEIERVEEGLEAAVKKLGYKPEWIPII